MNVITPREFENVEHNKNVLETRRGYLSFVCSSNFGEGLIPLPVSGKLLNPLDDNDEYTTFSLLIPYDDPDLLDIISIMTQVKDLVISFEDLKSSWVLDVSGHKFEAKSFAEDLYIRLEDNYSTTLALKIEQ